MRHFNLSGWAVSHPALILFLVVALGATGSRGGTGGATTSAAGAIFWVRATATGAGGSMGVKVVGEGAAYGDGAVEATTRCARRVDVAGRAAPA